MKKIKVAIATLIIIPLLILTGQIYLHRTALSMVSILDEVEKYERVSDTDKAKHVLDNFQTKWGFHKQIVATFVRHAEIDFANQSAAKLKPLIDCDDKAQFYAECETLKMQINHIEDTEKLTFDNIL